MGSQKRSNLVNKIIVHKIDVKDVLFIIISIHLRIINSSSKLGNKK